MTGIPTSRVRRSALVVDDSEDQGNLLRLHLRRLDYEVTVVGTAEAAISSYHRLAPTVAIVDLLLPGIDGWQLISTMKRDVPDCVLVVTSVLGLEDYPLVDGVLPKPFTGADVARVLGALFEQDGREFIPRPENGGSRT